MAFSWMVRKVRLNSWNREGNWTHISTLWGTSAISAVAVDSILRYKTAKSFRGILSRAMYCILESRNQSHIYFSTLIVNLLFIDLTISICSRKVGFLSCNMVANAILVTACLSSQLFQNRYNCFLTLFGVWKSLSPSLNICQISGLWFKGNGIEMGYWISPQCSKCPWTWRYFSSTNSSVTQKIISSYLVSLVSPLRIIKILCSSFCMLSL